ncbi:MarR family winged helix-turn-helix transcriptional regulator [Afipia sp. DC4300-2b1]|uniref:MarR family winged helix-turn-helix transcriptional regulator n=1 Tax=Afipia sp. DC4300-2b1 TaxID=2804672 RepID=UPI003CE6B30D
MTKKIELVAEDFAQCICLGLRKGARQTTQIYDEFLAPSGIRITQFGLLAHLEISKAPLSVSALATELSMDPTTLNRNLKPLEKRKLVRMITHDRDRRSKIIALTSSGRKLLWRAAPLWKAAHDHVYELLGKAEAAALSKTLDVSLAHFKSR